MVAKKLNIPRVFHADSGIFPNWPDEAEECERDDDVGGEPIESPSAYPPGLSLDIFNFHLVTCLLPFVLSSIFQHSLLGFELLQEIVISELQLRFPFP